MVGGMGGLTSGFSDLADGQDRANMMNPAAIMSNLEHGNMLMGPAMRPAITAQGAASQSQLKQQTPPLKQSSSSMMSGGAASSGGMMVNGGNLKSIGQ